MKTSKLTGKLTLKNDSGLSVFFIGVGSAFSKIHNQTNILITKNDDHLLIDCGTCCAKALYDYGLNIADIDNLFISHSHADHIGNLEEFALMCHYIKNKKSNMIITNDYKKKLWNESLKGGLAYSVENNKKIMKFDDYFNQIKPTRIKKSPRPVYQTNVGSIDVKIFRTLHIPENETNWKKSMISYGILIDERILFSLDSKFDTDILYEMLQDYPTIEYIFHDCQIKNGDVHAWYNDLAELSDEVKKIMYLCHYSDNYKIKDAKADGFAGFAEQGVFYNFDD